MQPRELDPMDLGHLARPYDTIPLPDYLAEGIALGTIYDILDHHKRGTSGPLTLGAPEGLRHELQVKGPMGRVATIPLSRADAVAPPRELREADARFLVEIKNNADWILRAAVHGLKHGFVP